MKKERLIENSSEIHASNSEVCEVVIVESNENTAAFNDLFRDQRKLTQGNDIHFFSNNHAVIVTYDGLLAQSVDFRNARERGHWNKTQEILRELAKRNLIVCLTIDATAGTASFSYASHMAKALLTNEGKMLEVYVYHKLKRDPRFDDVVTGYEVEWGEGTGVKNEFDVVATRGYSSLFIECKDQRTISQEYYYKLASLVDQMGIHARAVLIADTRGSNEEANTIQSLRGSMLGVTTITEYKEIEKINETLLQLLDQND